MISTKKTSKFNKKTGVYKLPGVRFITTLRAAYKQPRLCYTSSFCTVKNRYRPNGVFGKGVGNASEMRQKCVRNASELRQKGVEMGSHFMAKRGTFQNASETRQNCVKNAQKCAEHLWGRTPVGRYRKKDRFCNLFSDLGGWLKTLP